MHIEKHGLGFRLCCWGLHYAIFMDFYSKFFDMHMREKKLMILNGNTKINV
jgi:hypothetical protein